MRKINRRDFLRLSSIGFGSAVVLNTLGGCAGFQANRNFETTAKFTHGVASGDPLSTKVIVWTRAVPEVGSVATVTVQLALDEAFTKPVYEQSLLSTNAERDFTLKFDVINLEPNTTYYYRFLSKENISPIGKTRTLPVGNIDEVKLLTVSCSYYSAGYFNVYKEAAKVKNVNAAIHLGDYIYEYGPGIYADEDAVAMNRVMQPAKEILTLKDYRQRYAQTRSDVNCQAFHAAHPLIAIWDDHEVCNDTWSNGAENHSKGEGNFSKRRLAALQAYAEWMPIRPPVDEDITSIQRSFEFGNLVNLSLVDTRLANREEQLSYATFTNTETGVFDGEGFFSKLHRPERELIGKEQLEKIANNFSKAIKWQVLGQQVLMGNMHLPAPIATQQISNADYGKLVYKAQNDSEKLTEQEKTVLQAPSIPYNLDAWDGYPAERERVLKLAKDQGVNLIVLAGDTHNAWMNELFLDKDKVGHEFACSSVSSPGLEKYINSTSEDEAGTVQAIPGLKYCNLVERGYMTITFNQNSAEAVWNFVDTVKSADYKVLIDRRKTHSVHLE